MMFYIYSSKGWARLEPTKSGNWWGTFATARPFGTIEEANMALRGKQRCMKQFNQAVIMKVEQL